MVTILISDFWRFSFCLYRIGNLNVELSVPRMSFHFELVIDCLIVIERWNSNQMQVDLVCIHVNQERKFKHSSTIWTHYLNYILHQITFPSYFQVYHSIVLFHWTKVILPVLMFVFNFSPISLNTLLSSSPLPGWNKFVVLKYSYPVFKYLIHDFAWIHFVLWSIQCKM